MDASREMNRRIIEQLWDLESRVARLERAANVAPDSLPQHVEPTLTADGSGAFTVAESGAAAAIPGAPPVAPATSPLAPPTEPPVVLAAPATPAHDERPPAATPAATPARDWSLERLIGGRYFLAAGSLVVVIGVGLFLKLGYDQGWFRMSAAWKCIWGALFGVVMIASGELARRRINVLASTGLSAAGLGALYLSCYAAHGFYSLIGGATAFVLLAATAALGVGLAALARLVLVAALAMLGGYLAPFILHVESPSPFVLPLHTLALLATGLVLSGWKPGVFRWLRGLAWWGTVILGTIWVAQQGLARPLIALPFLALVWAGIHAELILSVRDGLGDAATGEKRPPRPALVLWRTIRPVATSFTTSAWCVLLGVVVLRNTPVLPDWFVPAAGMGAAALLSMVLAGHLRVLKDSPRTDAQRLGAGLAMQAGALLITAVALAFSGSLEVCAWLALGAAAVGAAAWVRAPSLGVYGVVVLVIGTLRLVSYDAIVTRGWFQPVHVAGLALDRWSLLMAAGAASWASAALLLLRLRDGPGDDDDAPQRPMRSRFLVFTPPACAFAGLLLLLGSVVHPETSTGAASVAWMLIGTATCAAGVFERRLRLELFGLGALALATLGWALAYVAPGWTATAHGAMLHRGFLVGGALAVALAALAARYRRLAPRDERIDYQFWMICAAWAAGLAWCVSSLEVYRLCGMIGSGTRASLGGLSVWWSVSALLIILVGARRRIEGVSVCGVLVMALAVLSWLAAFVLPGWDATSNGALVHPGFIIAAALVCALAVSAALEPQGMPRAGMQALLLGLGAASLAWLATSLEAFRVAQRMEQALGTPLGGLAAWWGCWALALLHIGFRRNSEAIRIGGLAMAGMGIAAWGVAFIAPGWTASARGALVHPGFIVAALLVAGLGIVAIRRRELLKSGPRTRAVHVVVCAVASISLAWVATSFEVFRLSASFEGGKQGQHAAVSVWWGLFAVGLIIAGFRWRAGASRYAGLALLGVATVKALIVDLADVSAGWRVVSVLGLGLLMLGVALAYVHTSARLATARHGPGR